MEFFSCLSELWTLLGDIEDCTPYFPIGIGSPSQYTFQRKRYCHTSIIM
jgi:hypothetical protein